MSLPSFTLEGGARRPLRRAYARLEREGCSYDILPPEGVPPILAELKSDLGRVVGREAHAGEGLLPRPLQPSSTSSGCHWWLFARRAASSPSPTSCCGAEREEMSIDLMRHLPTAPAGVMDYILVELMLWGKQQGYRWFNLGMAPMSGFEDRALAPLWSRVGVLPLPPRRALLQLSRPAAVQGEIRSRVGAALPRVARRIGAPPDCDQRRIARFRWPQRGLHQMKRAAWFLLLLAAGAACVRGEREESLV